MLYYYCLDYNGQLLVHAVCLAVLLFCHFIVTSLFLLFSEINADGDGDGDIVGKHLYDL